MKTLKELHEKRNNRATRIHIIKKSNGGREYIPQYADTLNYKIECIPILCFGVLFSTFIVAAGLCVKFSIEVPFFVFVLSFFSPLIFTVISYQLDLNWIYHDIWKHKTGPVTTLDEAKDLIERYLINIDGQNKAEEADLEEEKRSESKTSIKYPYHYAKKNEKSSKGLQTYRFNDVKGKRY